MGRKWGRGGGGRWVGGGGRADVDMWVAMQVGFITVLASQTKPLHSKVHTGFDCYFSVRFEGIAKGVGKLGNSEHDRHILQGLQHARQDRRLVTCPYGHAYGMCLWEATN